MYHRVGTYQGETSLADLEKLAKSIDVSWAATGYGINYERTATVRDKFQPLVGDALPGVWAYSMIVLMKPDSSISFHKDEKLFDAVTRYHLVIATNHRCWSAHDSTWQQLELGGIYKLDPLEEHASLNWGDSTRIHLVVDVEDS